jgi:hypothetical protein
VQTVVLKNVYRVWHEGSRTGDEIMGRRGGGPKKIGNHCFTQILGGGGLFLFACSIDTHSLISQMKYVIAP